MNSYTVCFELFGKKMKLTDVKATSEDKAKEYVKDCIKFHIITDNMKLPNKRYNDFKEIFNSVSKIFDSVNKQFDSVSKILNK